MKIVDPLTLSSLKENFHRLTDELKVLSQIEVCTEQIDTAGIQFLIILKKNYPIIKIILVSKESQNLALLLGANPCL